MVHSSRGKGKGRSRILYWFRTPPGVKVGRSALDDESVRMIQATHPDIEFDWQQLLKGRQEPAPERPRQEPSARSERPGRAGEKADRRARPEPSRRPERRSPAPAETPQPAAPEPPAAPVETGPAAARLGPAGVQRLRARYAEIVGRLQSRVDDEARRTELNALADRLNPDNWATDADVAAGLEGYEATYEAVKTAIGSRRRPVPDTPSSEDPDGEPSPDRPV